MCGRFTLTYKERQRLADELGVSVDDIPEAEYRPRYNIAPTDPHWIVRARYEDRVLVPAKWGLINSWAKDGSRAAKQINARAEGLRGSNAFREAFAQRRCIVPADGFYEWTGAGPTRQPIWFHRPDGGLLLFAGLYESWQPRPEQWQRTFTIITTVPSPDVVWVHDRMPVVLDERVVDDWLDPRQDLDKVSALLKPAPEGFLTGRIVLQRANSVRNDDPACLEPAELVPRLL